MSDNPQAVATAVYAAVNARDLDALDRLYAPDVTVNGAPSSPEQLKSACLLFLEAFGDLEMSVERLITDGGWVATRVVGRGTHTADLQGIAPTGRPIAVAQHDLIRIEDGKIVEVWNLYDQFGMLQQIGAVPTPETV
jgi:predicted ester cyclase